MIIGDLNLIKPCTFILYTIAHAVGSRDVEKKISGKFLTFFAAKLRVQISALTKFAFKKGWKKLKSRKTSLQRRMETIFSLVTLGYLGLKLSTNVWPGKAI